MNWYIYRYSIYSVKCFHKSAIYNMSIHPVMFCFTLYSPWQRSSIVIGVYIKPSWKLYWGIWTVGIVPLPFIDMPSQADLARKVDNARRINFLSTNYTNVKRIPLSLRPPNIDRDFFLTKSERLGFAILQR